MLIVPLAHESQRVQRLPWVTFTFIAINLIVFLFTNFGGVDEAELDGKIHEFYDYLSAHPYLEVPANMDKFLSDQDREQLETMRDSFPMSSLSQETIDSEQEELNAISEDVDKILNNSPYNKYGYIPAKPRFITLFTCIFIHSGWLHLIGNMLFLYLAGCSIEDLWGRPLYIAFYFVSGMVATWMHAARFPHSTVALVGASGAIAGLMGAFAVRLYNTRITFFYLLFLRPGTFRAPAYVMLPLWLAQQLIYANQGESEVAFHAHIGGFLFGALVAAAIKYTGFEDKYLAPAIEKKISLVQNPLYLEAMELSEKGDLTKALVLLEKVVRQEPNNLDALMEMQRIADINQDQTAHNKYTARILDLLIRTKEAELLRTTYHQYLDRHNHLPLPAKTLFGLAGFFEEENEILSALQVYEVLIALYPDDPFAMKAWSKMYRIYFDKQNEQQKGKQALIRAYDHPQATDPWRSALQTEFRKYGVPIPEVAKRTSVSAAAAAIAEAPSPPPARSVPNAQAASDGVVSPGFLPAASALPNPAFDGESDGEVAFVPCRVQKIVLKGLLLNNENQMTGLLPFKSIRFVSSGRIQNLDAARPDKDSLVLDLVAVQSSDSKRYVVYRIDGQQIPFNKLFPLLEQTPLEAFQNFAGIIVNNSGAVCLPDHDHCLGPVFAQYANSTRYENQLREKLV